MIQSPAGYQGDVRIKRYLDFYQAGYGVAMLSSGVAFSPLSLFANGEQGVWYDPSDMTTLFQDSARTTAVTAVEQPVGCIDDKSGNGFNATQSTSASRPVLSARVNTLVNTDTLSTQSVTTLATNYTLRFEGTGSIALSGTGSGTYSAGSHTVTCTAGTLTLTVTGSVTNADLRPANAGVNLPVYQRVVTATDYDTTGFPMYLRFDGTDDFLQSSTITPGVDKAQVFAGVRKLSDAAGGIVMELSVASAFNDGTLAFNAPAAGTPDYFWRSKGTISASSTTAASYPAPLTSVMTGIGDIAGDVSQLRYNGAQILNITTDQGTGNYLSYPLYIGRRGGSTLPFNGNLYSLILRFSAANLDAATITATETWVNGKTRAY